MSYKKALLIFTGVYIALQLLLFLFVKQTQVMPATWFAFLMAFIPHIITAFIFVRSNGRVFNKKELWATAIYSVIIVNIGTLSIDLLMPGESFVQNFLSVARDEIGDRSYMVAATIFYVVVVGGMMFLVQFIIDLLIYKYCAKLAMKLFVKRSAINPAIIH